MRTIGRLIAPLGLLLVVPALSFAGLQTPPPKPTPAAKPPAAAAKPAPAATHATSGTVKSVDAASLVITKVAPKGSKATTTEMTFVLNAATQRKGDMVVGSMVDVRYKTENKQNIATAVTAKVKK